MAKKRDNELVQVGELLPAKLTPQQRKKIERIELARQAQADASPDVGFSSRPFVLCGLPLRRAKGSLIHIRKNGKFFLRVTGGPGVWVTVRAGSANSALDQYTSRAPEESSYPLRRG